MRQFRLLPVPAGGDPLGSDRSPYTAVAEDLTFAEAEEWLDSLEGQGVRSRVVNLTPAGRVSVWWAA
jgi:hypothetical protein